MRHWIATVFAAGMVLTSFNRASACDAPVFRYAYEKWDPTPYELAVFSQGTPAPQTTAAAKVLESGNANLYVSQNDVAHFTDSTIETLWKQQKPESMPWAVLRSPQKPGAPEMIWSGTLTTVLKNSLLNSPKRQALVKALKADTAAVFVLLEGTDAAANDAAAKIITDGAETIAKLKRAELRPEQTAIGFKIEFSVLRVNPADPAEFFFVKQLTQGAAEVKYPAAVPVFGQGRALTLLPNDQLTADTVQNVVGFLVSECSCQVKDANPGYDLLLATDWREGKSRTWLEEAEPPLPSFSPYEGLATGAESAVTAGDKPAATNAATLANPATPAAAVPAPVPDFTQKTPEPVSNTGTKHRLYLIIGCLVGLQIALMVSWRMLKG